MKYNIKEIQKALELITKNGGPTDVDVTIDPRDRLVISYSDTLGGDEVVITIFGADINMLAKITRTNRL